MLELYIVICKESTGNARFRCIKRPKDVPGFINRNMAKCKDLRIYKVDVNKGEIHRSDLSPLFSKLNELNIDYSKACQILRNMCNISGQIGQAEKIYPYPQKDNPK